MAVRSRSGDYHLLVAQNFLANISLNGHHTDTNLRIFNRPGVDCVQCESADVAIPECPLESARPTATRGKRKTHSTPKRSIFHRFTRIVSSDETAVREEESRAEAAQADWQPAEGRPGSPASITQNFAFLRRLRYTLAKGESTERIRHLSGCSTEELRPFDFKEGEEFAYGHLFGGRRGRLHTMAAGERSPKPDRRESVMGDSLLAVDKNSLPAAISRASSCDPGFGDILPGDIINEVGEGDSQYEPGILTEVEGAQRAVVRFSGYTSCLMGYSCEEDSKRQLNERFRAKFPNIQLTYSKFRSLKRELLCLCSECDIDLSTLALAFVYFERIVLKGLISKGNRKLVAGACFLVAVKVTDVGRFRVRELIENVEEKFRVSRKELLQLELPLCVALDFALNPPQQHVRAHLDRLLFGVA